MNQLIKCLCLLYNYLLENKTTTATFKFIICAEIVKLENMFRYKNTNVTSHKEI